MSPAPLRISLRPAASTAFRVVAVVLSAGLAGALAASGSTLVARVVPWAAAIAALAGIALALRSTGVKWEVDLSDDGADFVPLLGTRRKIAMADLALQVSPDRLQSTDVDLALTPPAHATLLAWLDLPRFVPYGTPPGMVRYVPRTAVYGPTAERSPVPIASNMSWSRRRESKVASVPWLVPTPLRARAPGAVAGTPTEARPADVAALGKALESSPGDPTSVHAGDRVPIWPVCCGALAQHQAANPVRHELLLCIDEAQLGALESALVDPVLARRDTPDEKKLAAWLEGRFMRDLANLRGGIRPKGLDVFRCQECLRIYVTYAP